MRSLRLSIVSLCLLFAGLVEVCAQDLRVGFYNVENLFDTINAPNVDDGDFTPQGKKRWTSDKYEAKVNRLVEAVELFAPDILGVCEIENYATACDFARRTEHLHGVVHYDSRDSRGIDQALLYDTAKFRVVASEPIYIGKMRRPFLRVDMLARSREGFLFTVFVVHLPSKLGAAGAARRRAEAIHALDSVSRSIGNVIVMGDFNDSPRAVGGLYNCAQAPHNAGQGSYAYRDVWDMIDQIHVSRSLLPHTDGVQRVAIDKKLIQTRGRYAGYPLKGTVSDHLPIFLELSLPRLGIF